MLYIQTNQKVSLFQKIVGLILLIAILAGTFFVLTIIWPVIVALLIFIAYKVHQFKKKLAKAREQMYQQQEEYQNAYAQQHTEKVINEEASAFSQAEQSETQSEVIYDISPNDYSVEEKK